MIRVLTPDDRDLIAEALSWTEQQPRWLQESDAVWGTSNVDDYLKMMKEDPQVDFGVFDDEALHGVITVCEVIPKYYNCHIMCKRRANVDLIIDAGQQILAKFRGLGLQETTAWPMSKNSGMRSILEGMGFSVDGVTRIKGQSHGQLLTWTRYSARAM